MRRLGVIAVLALASLVVTPARASGQVSRDIRFTPSDGISLQTTVTGAAPLVARPVIVEFSPYGRNSGTLDPGPDYNFLLVQIRGTGDSDGQFDALGPRTQADVVEVLRWACHQQWSDGNLGLNGFSASAITVYNSLHLPLPCVRAAVLKSGTFELYRDLLSPGGTSNAAVGIGVLALIGTPAADQGLSRLERNPGSAPGVAAGLVEAGVSGGLEHPNLDGWWRERGFRGDVNHLPILMIDGFFDVESRGAFQAFQALRGDGAHLMVIGAHDGAPQGTDGGVGESRAWLDHYIRGIANGVQTHPTVMTWLSEGDRLGYLGGAFARYDAADWPIPGTHWMPLHLDPAGSLDPAAPTRVAHATYPAVPSLPTATDPPNTAILGGDGLNALGRAVPPSEQTNLAATAGLTYTTSPFPSAVVVAGPLDLDLPLATAPADTGIWAIVTDVWPDGTSHPLTVGRLNTAYPRIDPAQSLTQDGRIVQPYGIYSSPSPAAAGRQRLYHVEFWPIGNRFAAGHRLGLVLVGTSAASKPAPGLDTIEVGGPHGAVLEVPVVPAP